jgi:hypothetical protein
MAYITLATFVDGLEAITVEGVTRRYIHGVPAGVVNAPAVPALFIAYPVATGGKLVFGSQGGTGNLTAQLHILVKAVAQDYQERNFDSTVRMADALETALFDVECAIGGPLGWSVRVTVVPVAGHDYWTVLADVEGGRWA